MNHLPFKPVKEWFGYTRRERRASFIIFLLTAAIAGARFIIPESGTKPEVMTINPGITINETTHIRSNPSFSRQRVGQQSTKQKRIVINLNTCDSAALEGLPGIGPVLSRRIIKYRKLLGGFVSTGQLREVYGLTDSTFNLISGRVSADSLSVKKININLADYKQLIRLPYFEKYDVTAILKYRNLEGRINSIDELVKNKVIAAEKANKVRHYLRFD